jgi:DNA modification methylase
MGLFDLSDGIKKGKGLDSLKKSRMGRSELIATFGGAKNLPSSVMKGKRKLKSDSWQDGPQSTRGYLNMSPEYQKLLKRQKKAKGKLSRADLKSFSVSCQGCAVGALSTFPQNIGHSMVTLYSNPGDVVFDPFAGHNSRMSLCVKAGRNYIGCDLSHEFMEFNREHAEVLRKDYRQATIELHEGDSRKVPVKKNIGDFTITSPPYWDIEYYGDEKEQLGKSTTYEEFLEGIGEVMKENFRVLKPGAYAMWFINDFRKAGKMYFYHMDILRLGEAAGFIAHDIMIVNFGPGIRDCFLNQIMKQRILPKSHEYGVVFKKPHLVKKDKGKK